MNKHFIKKLFPLLVASMLLSGCLRNKDFSNVPHLEWRDYEIRDTAGNRRNIDLTVYFTDGDGDIGKDSSDMDCPPTEEYDLTIFYFEKVGNSYREVFPPDSCQLFHTFLPDIKPEGQNPTLEGEMTTPFSYFAYPKNPGVDSVKFMLQLQDRAGNRSPLIESEAIFIPPR